ncbi:GNAT family N-acetyltransferase [Paenibacillus sacheonensis]|uniref:GNAT family N-acetyltransferase n=1 Tax=Paenibacillus sacheonensis TaxID=742054 RepID=A0A7X4YW48_9BACL|nr:GNAT family N-acetyltransferase [Paenibacillus sacheonensis]MBM7568836.1 GNAT superfamily N-acetyltransferase [Paenibacillus sacheonensis]NBC72539.1 GNAT family N-acetyltransferase [Paenibacillus sacheonensis]
MSDIRIHACTGEDVHVLALLNKQLIEDEKHDNPMSIEQLQDRMRQFMEIGYAAYTFVEDERLRGYALVDHRRDPLYVRQFFICRDSRRNGYGRLAFAKLLAYLDSPHIDIEVLRGNESGYAFWKSLGFQERSVYMRLELPQELQ